MQVREITITVTNPDIKLPLGMYASSTEAGRVGDSGATKMTFVRPEEFESNNLRVAIQKSFADDPIVVDLGVSNSLVLTANLTTTTSFMMQVAFTDNNDNIITSSNKLTFYLTSSLNINRDPDYLQELLQFAVSQKQNQMAVVEVADSDDPTKTSYKLIAFNHSGDQIAEVELPIAGRVLPDNNEIHNDVATNTANTINAFVEGTHNNARIGNAHVEGANNNSTAFYGFKIISKDVAWASDRSSTITLDSVDGIEPNMSWNVFTWNTDTDGTRSVEKYRGNIASVNSVTKQVVLASSESDAAFILPTSVTSDSPIGFFIVNGGTIGSTQIIDKSGEFTSHCEGIGCTSAINSHAEGVNTQALGYASHSEGYYTQALGERAHSEGYRTKAQGHESHTEGASTLTTGAYSHAEGANTQANGEASHVEGRNSKANGRNAHAEGMTTIADGVSSHTEGTSTKAQAENAHSEGFNSIAKGINSHSEGKQTEANGYCSHAEGESSIADGDQSHAEGSGTKAKHLCSHTEGVGTESSSSYQHVGGTYNVVDDGEVGYLHIIGNGTSESSRSNAYTLDKKGNGWLAGDLRLGGTDYSNGKAVATQEYVDAKVSETIASYAIVPVAVGVTSKFSLKFEYPINIAIPDGKWVLVVGGTQITTQTMSTVEYTDASQIFTENPSDISIEIYDDSAEPELLFKLATGSVTKIGSVTCGKLIMEG